MQKWLSSDYPEEAAFFSGKSPKSSTCYDTFTVAEMPSFLAYIEEQKQLPKCLTMSLAAYIAFYSNDIQERTADGLICKRLMRIQ